VILTTYTWSASANGNANVAGNWTPNGVPTVGDTVVFAGNVPYECNWNIAKVSIMDIQAGFTGTVKFATNCVISTGLSINEERRINPSAAVTITFDGTPAYYSNLVFVKMNCADMVSEDGLFNNLHFIFGGTTRPNIDAGKYPHMTFEAGFNTSYITPTLSANEFNIYMQSITLKSGSVVAPSSPVAKDRAMNWIITLTNSHNGGANQFNAFLPADTFNGGAGTWTFQAKTTGFTFPVTGSPIYNDWTFNFENVIIDGTANGSGGFVRLIAGSILRLTNLTINSGCSVKGNDATGATIHLVNRPTIKGTWGFLPIADGIYYYKGIYNLGVSGGGTGLITVAKDEIPFGFNSQKLNTNGNFKFDDTTNILTIGSGGMIINTSNLASPAANQLWVNNSNVLHFGSSAVGGGGSGITSIATTAPITGGTITTTGTIGISAATTIAAGSMSAADKTKLDLINQSVASGASPNFTTTNMTDASNKRFMTDAQEAKLDGLASPFEHVRLALTNNALATQSSGTNYYLDLANTGDFSNTGNTTNIIATAAAQDYVLLKAGGMYMVVASVEVFTGANTAAQDFWLQLGNGTSSNPQRRNWGTFRIKRAPSPSSADSAVNMQKTVIIDVPSTGSDEKLYVIPYVNGASFTVKAYDNNRTNVTITRIGVSTT